MKVQFGPEQTLPWLKVWIRESNPANPRWNEERAQSLTKSYKKTFNICLLIIRWVLQTILLWSFKLLSHFYRVWTPVLSSHQEAALCLRQLEILHRRQVASHQSPDPDWAWNPSRQWLPLSHWVSLDPIRILQPTWPSVKLMDSLFWTRMMILKYVNSNSFFLEQCFLSNV